MVFKTFNIYINFSISFLRIKDKANAVEDEIYNFYGAYYRKSGKKSHGASYSGDTVNKLHPAVFSDSVKGRSVEKNPDKLKFRSEGLVVI